MSTFINIHLNIYPISTTHRHTIISVVVYAKVKKSSKWVKIGSASRNFLNLGARELGNFIRNCGVCHSVTLMINVS